MSFTATYSSRARSQSRLGLRRIPTLDGKRHIDGASQQVGLRALTLFTVGHERQHLQPRAQVLECRSGGVAESRDFGGREPITHRSPSISGPGEVVRQLGGG